MLPIQAPTSMASRELVWFDAMCGTGSFHQAFRAVARILARDSVQSPTTARWTCGMAFDNKPDLAAAYRLNYPGTPWMCADITAMSSWSLLRTSDHLLCAGPPCQGWTRTGRNMRWLDTRSLPLIALPMMAFACGIPCLLVEEVPPFRERGFADWARLWDLVGYYIVTCEHEAAEANPMARPRVLFYIFARWPQRLVNDAGATLTLYLPMPRQPHMATVPVGSASHLIHR